jgi:hypothetical protein
MTVAQKYNRMKEPESIIWTALALLGLVQESLSKK